MTLSPRHAAAALALLAPLLLAPDLAAAQNPSADAITRGLSPGGNMMGGNRGLRLGGSGAAPADAPRPTAAAPPATPTPRTNTGLRTSPPATTPPATAAAAPSVNLSVQFATNSADLTPAAVRTLTELGRALSGSALASYRFRIEGHTDTAGQPEVNKALSERRAQAVVAYLTSTFHIDAARLEAVGMGSDGLLVQTPANTPEPRNRRVQVINLGA